MKMTISMICFAAMLVAAGPADKDVLAAMESWKQATMKKDRAALENLLHDDLTYSHSNAKNESKADVLQSVTAGKATVEGIDFSGTAVRVYGNTALVKGNVTMRNNTDGKSTATNLNVLHVWVKGPKGWQMVARQATRLNP